MYRDGCSFYWIFVHVGGVGSIKKAGHPDEGVSCFLGISVPGMGDNF